MSMGFSLVEVILSVAVFSMIVTGFFGAIIYGPESTRLSIERSRAIFFAEEALEAVKNICEEDFLSLSDGTYGLVLSGGQWTLSGTFDQDDIFTRTITIETIDEYTKRVVTSIIWEQNEQRSGTISQETYLTNWDRPMEGAMTDLVVDVTNAVLTNQNSIIQDVVLENVGLVDLVIAKVTVSWQNAELIDRMKFDNTIVWNGNQVGTPLGQQPSGTELDIEDLTLSPGDGFKENKEILFTGDMSDSVFTIIFTLLDGSTKEVIVDFSEEPPPPPPPPPDWTIPRTEGIFNAPSTAGATDVFVFGTQAYLTISGVSDYFYVIDVSTSSLPTLVESLGLDDGPEALGFDGNNVFIASQSNNEELQVLDVSVPEIVSGYDKPGNSDASAVEIVGNTLYLGTNNVGGGNELYILDITDSLNPIFQGGVSVGNDINDIAIAGNYAYLAVGSDTEELQIVDISNPFNPTVEVSLDLLNSSEGRTVFISGNYLYMGKEKTKKAGEFYIIDISDPLTPVVMNPNGYEIGESVNDIVVSGTTAFLARNNGTDGFMTFDVSVPSLPSLLGSLGFSGSPTSVFFLNNVVYLATDNRNQELVIIYPY
ncbi:hypothetical protein KAI58_03765 [Candidatus Gracilibacteria bacterium]|nr:hypothetical protein [Candidatus Gracilibacteria bacterium]